MKNVVPIPITLSAPQPIKIILVMSTKWIETTSPPALSGICNAAHIAVQFAIIQTIPGLRIMMYGVELQIQS